MKEESKSDGRPYGSRYVGTLVADAHRTCSGWHLRVPMRTRRAPMEAAALYERTLVRRLRAAPTAATDPRSAEEAAPRTALVLGSRVDVTTFGASCAASGRPEGVRGGAVPAHRGDARAEGLALRARMSRSRRRSRPNPDRPRAAAHRPRPAEAAPPAVPEPLDERLAGGPHRRAPPPRLASRCASRAS
jgi:hypothetical protein